MKKGEVLSTIQSVEDEIVNRFCSVKRRLERQMDWVPDDTPFAALEETIREEIVFYEARGYFLFQEPWLEHEPVKRRYRVVLTFRPTELNQ